jgi:hypothetical protein
MRARLCACRFATLKDRSHSLTTRPRTTGCVVHRQPTNRGIEPRLVFSAALRSFKGLTSCRALIPRVGRGKGKGVNPPTLTASLAGVDDCDTSEEGGNRQVATLAEMKCQTVPEPVSPRYRCRVRKRQAGAGSTLSSMNRTLTDCRLIDPGEVAPVTRIPCGSGGPTSGRDPAEIRRASLTGEGRQRPRQNPMSHITLVAGGGFEPPTFGL